MTTHPTNERDVARADLACDCFGDRPELWGAACKNFDDDDEGCCYNCGHGKACHENP